MSTGIVARYEGHIGSTKGDGVLAVFGHPNGHEDDAHRAVLAGLDIIREVADLSARAAARFGFDIDVRVGIHRGLVYLDIAQDDVYGLGANLAARICSLARPGDVSVSAWRRTRGPRTTSTWQSPPGPTRQRHRRGQSSTTGSTAERDPAAGTAVRWSVGRRNWRACESRGAQASAGTLTTRGVILRGEGGSARAGWPAPQLDIAEESGAVVLELFGSPFHTDIGLRPVRRLIERRCGIRATPMPAESLRTAGSRDPEPVAGRRDSRAAAGRRTRNHSGRRYQTATANAGARFDQITAAVKEYLLACIGSGPA